MLTCVHRELYFIVVQRSWKTSKGDEVRAHAFFVEPHPPGAQGGA